MVTPNFVPLHIMANANDGRIYRTLMTKARISPVIIQHLSKMIDVKNNSDEKTKMHAVSVNTLHGITKDC